MRPIRHLLTAVIAALTLAGVSALAEQRPNVIFIVVDDLGYGELGCYGGKDIPTPQIDALAASGARFTSGYVTAPFCAASRAALMTGRYQTRFGFEFNPIGAKNAAPGIGLPIAEKTVADRLRDSGYATGLVGKWHLGGTAEFHPQRRGFDEFFGFLHEGHFYVQPPWQGVTTWLRRKTLPDGGQGRWTSPDGRIVWSTHLGSNEPEYDTDNPLLRSSQPVDEKANLTDAFTREACDFIARHRAQPFFLYLAYNAVHSPMQATDDDLKKFAHIEDIQRRIFAAMLTHLDDSMGKVLAQLRDSGIEENTLVVFLGDNGTVQRVIQPPYDIAGREHRSSTSVGVSLFGAHTGTLEETLKRSDVALYQAKAAGRNTLRFFDPDMQAAVHKQFANKQAFDGARDLADRGVDGARLEHPFGIARELGEHAARVARRGRLPRGAQEKGRYKRAASRFGGLLSNRLRGPLSAPDRVYPRPA